MEILFLQQKTRLHALYTSTQVFGKYSALVRQLNCEQDKILTRHVKQAEAFLERLLGKQTPEAKKRHHILRHLETLNAVVLEWHVLQNTEKTFDLRS